MGSETTPKLPVIDFTNESLKPGSSSWVSTAKDVRAALEEYSCFLAVYDNASKELVDNFFNSLIELFDLPEKTKMQNISDVPYFGYIGKQKESPLYESMGIGDSTSAEEVEIFTKKLWPNGNERFSEFMLSYGTKISELDKMITRMLFESYGVEKYCDSQINSTVYNVRMNKYRGPEENETNLGVFAHTDLGFIGINQQSAVDGLEVRLKDGSWVPVDFPPSSYIILAGDGMMENGSVKIKVRFQEKLLGSNDPLKATIDMILGVLKLGQEFKYNGGLKDMTCEGFYKAGSVLQKTEQLNQGMNEGSSLFNPNVIRQPSMPIFKHLFENIT